MRQYFEMLGSRRLKVIVLEAQDGKSAPAHLVERIDQARRDFDLDLHRGDELWLVFDRDHHFEPNHVNGTREALANRGRKGASVAVSNPCFETWLLLHHVEQTAPLQTGAAAEKALRAALGSYNKSRLDPSRFGREARELATSRAESLDATARDSSWLSNDPGSDVYKLMRRLAEFLPND